LKKGVFVRKIILLALSLILQVTETEACTNPDLGKPEILLRFTSLRVCGPCQRIKGMFLNAKLMKPMIRGTYFSGQGPILLDGVELPVRIEQVELDSPEIRKVILDPPINFKVYTYPHVQVFVDCKEVYAGTRDQMGGNETFTSFDTVEGIEERLKVVLRQNLVLP